MEENTVNVKKKSTGMKVVRVLITIVLVIMVILCGLRLYLRLPVRTYYAASEKAFVIPGLSDGLVPQGISYDEDSGLFAITGYQNKGEGTYIYRVKASDGSDAGRVSLVNEDGSLLTLHSGGLSVHGDYVYVAGCPEAKLYVFDRDEVLGSENDTEVKLLGIIDTFVGDDDGIVADFTTVYDDSLIVGEFYHEPDFITSESHYMTTPAGTLNHALAVRYMFSDDEDAVFGLEPCPSEAYSLPDIVQGMLVSDGYMYVSESYAVSFSAIERYDMSLFEEFSTLSTKNGDIPVYALDGNTLSGSLRVPQMSEEIELYNGRIYTMCESASAKYIFGKLSSAEWCYATDIDIFSAEK